MTQKNLSKEIKDYIKRHPDRQLSVSKIAKIFNVKKKNYKQIRNILRELESEGVLLRHKKTYTSPSPRKTQIGTFDATALAKKYPFGFVETENTDVKIYVENCLNAYHHDIVEFTVLKEARQGPVGKILKVIERKNGTLVGSAFKQDSHVYFVSDNPKIDTEVELFEVGDFSKISGKKIVIEISDWGNRHQQVLPSGKIIEILGELDDPNVDYLAIVKEYGLPTNFPEEVIREVEALPNSISENEISRRKDFRNLVTFTIDPKTAKDFDDALSFEKMDNGTFKLYVHIADVSNYVRVPSALFSDALERGTSIYLLQNVIPMLPFKLSNELCSLQPEVDRLTMTVIIDYSAEFKALGSSVYPSIIKSDQRLSYEQVDVLFSQGDNEEIEPEVKGIILQMRPLAKNLTKARYARGSLDFDLPDSEFIFDDQGSPIDILRTHQTESHLFIEEFMLAANEFVAKLIARKCSAAIFRIHEPPDADKIAEFARTIKAYGFSFNYSHKDISIAFKQFLQSISDEKQHRVYDYLLLRSLMKAKYSYRNIGHFGLALKSYTHFTSPIRRFPDLVVHHLIKQYVFEWTTKRFSLNEIKTYAEHSSEMEVRAMTAERSLGELKKNRFMRENMNDTFDALIVNFNKRNIYVELDLYPIEGYIPLATIGRDYYEFDPKHYAVIGKRSKQRFVLCQKLKVKVKRIIHDIEFEIVYE
ncbi:MAG: ribonuclease R [Candidatus Celaenobacter antarcticus]|nr:ribonuclease R [Candidatus Celaenobacter antarcticus]